MPVVKTSRIVFGGEPFTQRISCDSKGRFNALLPEPVWESNGGSKVSGATLEEVEKRFAAAVSLYQASKTSVNKVILYRFSTTCRILSAGGRKRILAADVDDGDAVNLSTECLHSRDDISFAEGTSLSLCAGVYAESARVNPDGTVKYSYKELPSALLPPGIRPGSGSCKLCGVAASQAGNRLDWTEQRERFFARLAVALEDLIVNLIDLTEEPARLAAMADTGVLKLAGPVEVPTANKKVKRAKKKSL